MSPKRPFKNSQLEIPKTILLVGLMGAGKTRIGKLLAAAFELPFVDADSEIEAAAGCTIEEIFAGHGEAAFRDGERRVIARLLDGPTIVLAAGGGAFMDPETRARAAERSITVWLRADLDLLVKRTARRNHRPLLRGKDAKAVLRHLIEERHPIYAEADIVVDMEDARPETVVQRVSAAIERYLGQCGDVKKKKQWILP
jgi:shikimate kinase